MNSKKKILALLMIVSSLCTLVSAAEIEELTNVALGKEAYASSEYNADYAAEYVCDGINDNEEYTKWKSGDSDMSPQITIDLGIEYKIEKIELEAAKGETSAAERSGFKITASNDENFKTSTELYVSNGTIGKDGILSVDVSKRAKFRFVRVGKVGEGALSFGEIKVFADTESLANITGADDLSSDMEASFTDEGKYIIPEDAKSEGIGDELGLLAAMKIMQGYPDGNFYPHNYISRAEIAAVATRLLNMQIIPSDDGFADVTKDHWAYEYVNAAKTLKLVNGVSDGIFMPDENITYEQLQKILVCALGYGEEAEATGGYPSGYAVIAARLRILNKISIEEEYVTRRDAAMALYNALMAKPFLKNADNTYETADENLLKYIFGVSYFDGTVDGVNGTSLTKDDIKLGMKRVSVGGNVYDTEYPYFDKLFSMNVRCYIDEDDVIIYACAKKTNERLEIAYDDFKSLKNDVISYYENEKEKTAHLKTDADVIYNGKALRSYNADEILDIFDRILLTDNDGDGNYEVLSIEYERIGVVSWVNTKEKTIYFKNTKEPLEYDEALKFEIISSADGKMISVEELREYDVLNMLESKDGAGEKLITVYVTTNEIYGAVTAHDDDFVVLKNKTYEIDGNFDVSSIKIGERMSYYTDRHSRIVYVKEDTVGKSLYGYLHKAYYDDTTEKGELKLFAANGKFEVYKLKKNIKLDGKNVKVSELTEKYLKKAAKFGDFGQPIRYEMNDSDEITLIDTLQTETGGEDDSFRCNVNLGDGGRKIYYSSMRIFDARYLLSDSVAILRIPEDTSAENEFEAESSSKYKDGYAYSFWGYGPNDDTIELIISREAIKVDREASKLLVVKKVYDVYTDEEAKKALSGYYDGEMVEFEEYTMGMIEKFGVKQGDVLAITLDSKNRIRGIQKAFYIGDIPADVSDAISTNSPVLGVNGEIYNIYQDFFIAYATVMTRKDGNMLLKIFNADGSECTEAKNNGEIMIKTPTGKIGVYDSTAVNESQRVYVGDASELIDAETAGGTENASKVIIKGRHGAISDFILLK